MGRPRTHRNNEELDAASWEAGKGAIYGAAKWGIYSGLIGVIAYAISPVYRGLTIQFKAFLQMSGMTIGSMIEADRRLRAYEMQVRRAEKLARDAALWRRYEQQIHDSEEES